LTVALGLTTFGSLLPDINQPFSQAGRPVSGDASVAGARQKRGYRA
jgi:hypothetical protein